jgi:hypothetical protein
VGRKVKVVAAAAMRSRWPHPRPWVIASAIAWVMCSSAAFAWLTCAAASAASMQPAAFREAGEATAPSTSPAPEASTSGFGSLDRSMERSPPVP